MEVESNDGGGSMFKSLAAKFQSDRKTKEKRNNIWGSVLLENTLASDMTGIGVGRTIKDLDSDRGAETYDYHLAVESRGTAQRETPPNRDRDGGDDPRETESLDKEMQEYWDSRKSDAIQAGRKRSIKDRLVL